MAAAPNTAPTPNTAPEPAEANGAVLGVGAVMGEPGAPAAPRRRLDPQLEATWLAAEKAAVLAELTHAHERLLEAKAWEGEAAQCMSGQTDSDPSRLEQLLAKGEALNMALPSMGPLRDYSAKNGASAQNGAPAPAQWQRTGGRPPMGELLRVQREGAKLRVSGALWNQLLAHLAKAEAALKTVHRALTHYAGPVVLGEALEAMDKVGIAFDEGATLRGLLTKLISDRCH
ncbi:hypothetical protein Ctob_002215 [Chrysochromulina tobinii]|uniref:Uncharacterized protein n=1 Tax=Chrysochromulina tobinii TaxID=1460289 RepID=A0A0M0JHC8_9EUKA|nr:hypothetical protein Ctob_002215 [Chrysochromulina tobinii]|eukprot:KOO25885.1 hypothetical protein Ctob_002215 [Chrysochromulina sp. CCMP291]